MKVFGGIIFRNGKQVRAIVATTSQKRAAELVGVSLSELRDYWSVTGNDIEMQTACSEPGRVFVASTIMGNDFKAI